MAATVTAKMIIRVVFTRTPTLGSGRTTTRYLA